MIAEDFVIADEQARGGYRKPEVFVAEEGGPGLGSWPRRLGEITGSNAHRFGDSSEEVWDYFIESWQQQRDRFFFFSVPDPKEPFCNVAEREFLLGRAASEFVSG